MVRAALRQLAGDVPIEATLDRSVTSDRKDRPHEEGRAKLDASAGPRGISIGYPPGLLAQFRAERADTDPEKPHPARRTLENFDATNVEDLLNSATGLLRNLEGAALKEVRDVDYKGQPARLLDLELVPRVSKADRKWLKRAAYSMRLWIAPDGVPLSAESEFVFRAGLLIFNFDGKDVEARAYGRVGDRLVTLRHTERFDGEGFGESQHTYAETTLAVKSGG
jgi:hypothetical protein